MFAPSQGWHFFGPPAVHAGNVRTRLQPEADCAVIYPNPYASTMAENLLIPLPGFELPRDFPWRVGFVRLVDDQLRKLRATGHFLPPRFFGYYFQAQMPVGVGGSWTVSLDAGHPLSALPGMLHELTRGAYSIMSAGREARPDFLLVHDRLDGACWLWSFGEGLQFVEAVEPVKGGDGDDWLSDADQPKLLGP